MTSSWNMQLKESPEIENEKEKWEETVIWSVKLNIPEWK